MDIQVFIDCFNFALALEELENAVIFDISSTFIYPVYIQKGMGREEGWGTVSEKYFQKDYMD